MSVLRASCLCRGVRFEIAGPLRPARNCHCLNCRKQHAAPFRSAARFPARDLTWIAGEDLVRFYESSPGTFRGFCSVCGSAVVNKFDGRSISAAYRPEAVSEYGVALGILDDDPGVRPAFHLFVARKPSWFEITDGLPQHPELPF
jgi:hypothetical protein